ncbi:hypothetical protein LEP1GSC080_2757 [Leptospira interrogans str. FPW2026]|nr:hypothetical protein LEP1GSC080_2757 [Leptospira interrogans str. FPW2026]
MFLEILTIHFIAHTFLENSFRRTSIFNTGRYVKQRCLKNKILTSLILTDLDLKQKLTPVSFSQNEGSLLEAKELLESCPVSLDVELQENSL